MYKKITKIKKVTKMFSSPYDKEVKIKESYDPEDHDDGDDDHDDNGDERSVEAKIYGDVVTMDIPFFVKLLEHVHTRITTSAELQTLAESIVNVAKTTPCLTTEEYDKVF